MMLVYIAFCYFSIGLGVACWRGVAGDRGWAVLVAFAAWLPLLAIGVFLMLGDLIGAGAGDTRRGRRG